MAEPWLVFQLPVMDLRLRKKERKKKRAERKHEITINWWQSVAIGNWVPWTRNVELVNPNHELQLVEQLSRQQQETATKRTTSAVVAPPRSIVWRRHSTSWHLLRCGCRSRCRCHKLLPLTLSAACGLDLFAQLLLLLGYLHKCLVVAANLLNVHTELGIDIGLDGAITMHFRASAAHQSGGILQCALILQTSGGDAAMAMSSLQHTGELGELELQW